MCFAQGWSRQRDVFNGMSTMESGTYCSKCRSEGIVNQDCWFVPLRAYWKVAPSKFQWIHVNSILNSNDMSILPLHLLNSPWLMMSSIILIYGGFHTWSYPKMEDFYGFIREIPNRWFRGTTILGNLHIACTYVNINKPSLRHHHFYRLYQPFPVMAGLCLSYPYWKSIIYPYKAM